MLLPRPWLTGCLSVAFGVEWLLSKRFVSFQPASLPSLWLESRLFLFVCFFILSAPVGRFFSSLSGICGVSPPYHPQFSQFPAHLLSFLHISQPFVYIKKSRLYINGVKFLIILSKGKRKKNLLHLPRNRSKHKHMNSHRPQLKSF